jgi:hypothetical protein
VRPRWQGSTDPRRQWSLRDSRPRGEPAVRLWCYASSRPTTRSRGALNSVAVQFPPRFARRRPLNANVGHRRPGTMADNLYAAPTAAVHDPPGADWSWRPVLLGAVVSVGTFFSLATVVSPLVQRWYTAQGIALEKLYQTMNTSLEAVLLWHLLAVCGFIMGGYVAAGRTSQRRLLAACLSAVLAKAILLAQYAGVFPNPYPVWSQILGIVTPVPAALFGGWVRIRRRLT